MTESFPRFVHLRLHSEFSIVDGTVRIDPLVQAAAADGQPALALTDSANMFGAVRFYQAARRHGIKPILGVDVALSNETDREQPHRLLLLAQDRAGYLNLCDLLSRAWLENQHRNRAELRAAWLQGASCAGLIALSGAAQGEIGMHLAAGMGAAARAAATRWAAAFPNRFYIEVQRAGRSGDEALVRASVALAAQLRLPVVATHPVQFLVRADFRAHEARVCIAEGYTLADPRRPRRFTEQQYFLTQNEMAQRFADLPAALANAVQIARRCSLELDLGRAQLPDYPTPDGSSLEEHLHAQSQDGLRRRLAALFPEGRTHADEQKYDARLEGEIRTINSMGFAGYFLIVADFINWAKSNDIPVGPGRGSGAGSLAAYALGITDLDPLRYDLLFERFLNPERVSMPDFDIDFCQDHRDRVIDYVKQKYGAQAVSQIATFGTLGAKAVVRDIGRVLDLPYTKCDQLSKLIPHNPADPWTLDRALADEPAFADAVAADEEAKELVALARPLEGLTRNVGVHAGGVLIAPGKLTDFCPLYCAQGTDAVISQYDKDDVEAIGLVKFDFLGLTTLTTLDLTLRYVCALDPAFAFTLATLPLDDPAVYDIFKRAQTVAIFQFESRGMRELLKRARPDRLEDLIALNALYRPGPMDLIADFVDRKQGRQRIDYLHPALVPILAETYGIMVYQEQVMRIAQVIGGYSLGSADLLRRAMGKKKADEMAQQRDIFVAGAERNGVSRDTATQLFDLMEKFAGYGFNKSHSAAYAVLAYQTAFFKAHYPAAFMAANLSAVMDDTDKIKELIEDSRHLGLTVLAPAINSSAHRFVPVDAKTIRYGLGAIKGTGASAISAIVVARSAAGDRSDGGGLQPFSDLFEFCARVDPRAVNRRAVEALVRAGAFDALGCDRALLFASVGRAIEQSERAAAHAGQANLFGLPGAANTPAAEYLMCKPWSERERLANEKLALGYYFSGHLFTEFEREARCLAPTRLADVRTHVAERAGERFGARSEPVRLAGIIASARTQNTRRGRMGVVVLDDGSAQLELMVFSELFDRKRALLKEDTLVFVTGRVRFDDFNQRLSISADDVVDLPEARARGAARLRIDVDGAVDAERLHEILAPYRFVAENPAPRLAVGRVRASSDANRSNGAGNGYSQASAGCRVVIHYRNSVGAADMALPDSWRIRPEDAVLADLKSQPRVIAATFAY